MKATTVKEKEVIRKTRRWAEYILEQRLKNVSFFYTKGEEFLMLQL